MRLEPLLLGYWILVGNVDGVLVARKKDRRKHRQPLIPAVPSELLRWLEPILLAAARDKAAVMKKYMSSFDPRILGLRGDGEETEAAAKAFHVYYRPVSLGNKQYTMDHSGFLYLMDPKGKFVSLLTGNLPGHDIANELKKQIK